MNGSAQRRDRAMASFVVQASGRLPPHVLEREGSFRRRTVLRAVVRDQAALYGLLEVLSDLGLDLLDLRQFPEPESAEQLHSSPPPVTPMTVELVIRHSLGDLALSALRDHVEVTHVATRLVLPDRLVLDHVIDWVRDAGETVEYAADVSSADRPVSTPPT